MHVALPDLRALRQGGLIIRYALLGPVAFVLAEVPAAGSSGTQIEQPSRQGRWLLVIGGELTYVDSGRSLRVPAGNALYVPPGGPEHRLTATGHARIAGFQPIDPSAEVTDQVLADRGYEILGPASASRALPLIAPTTTGRPPRAGVIDGRTSPMPPFALTVVQFGPASGYTADWCDAPHWGLVTGGHLVIEYEHDVEIVAAGDVYHCPAGEPAHRLQAADPATIVDLTPIEAISGGGRVAEWRREALAHATEPPLGDVSVVALG